MPKRLLLGYDIGSSFVKASLVDADSGECIGSASSPEQEMTIEAPNPGWAEQHPGVWWDNLVAVTRQLLSKDKSSATDVSAIGISYQMHGLVVIDKNHSVLRPSIIWCDSRAVEIGNRAFSDMGVEFCLQHFLNSPGNFTASKLRWVREEEPKVYEKIFKFMLPGDFVAMKLTGEVCTTISGLSEGILWDFHENRIAKELLDHYHIDSALIPDIVPTFAIQGKLTAKAASELGLKQGVPVSYRAGDQPNNALSLNVLRPGEVAATAGTSGVVYGVMDDNRYDGLSRVNQFAHVNHTLETIRLGVLLCVNGTGIMNSWLRKLIGGDLSYETMNSRAVGIQPGSDGLTILPFGNGAERILENKTIGARILGLDLNRHTPAHVFRAAQEGIAFALKYGMDIMNDVGLKTNVIRAGASNMFRSPVFGETLATVTGATIELYDTDGAQGAARGAAIGCGMDELEDVFRSLKAIAVVEPDQKTARRYDNYYQSWLHDLHAAVREPMTADAGLTVDSQNEFNSTSMRT